MEPIQLNGACGRTMKAYLDNMIVCGIVRSDLGGEMTAVRNILERTSSRQLEVLTSSESQREQDRTKDESVRSQFEQRRPIVPGVAEDHLLLGIRAQYLPGGGFYANTPILTEVVDETLLATLKAAGLKAADARHLMYAVHNGCDWFVTTDAHFLDRRPALEESCRGLRILKPSELVAELAAAAPW
jgi:predicted nucleic acid-binding protein